MTDRTWIRRSIASNNPTGLVAPRVRRNQAIFFTMSAGAMNINDNDLCMAIVTVAGFWRPPRP